MLTHWLLMTSILVLIEIIWSNHFGRNYLKKEKFFLNFCLTFRNLHLILKIFKKKMTLIADLFPKLRTPENVFRYMCKKSRFKRSFDRQHGKLVKTLLRSGQQHCYHIYWSSGRYLCQKKYILVRRKAL